MCIDGSVTRRARARQVNGKLVELSHALANAEVVEVLTYPGPPTALTVQRHQVRARARCLGPPESRARAHGGGVPAPALVSPWSHRTVHAGWPRPYA
jgi:hypothetical protein